jgi:mono/diheme cytochrome c family protein
MTATLRSGLVLLATAALACQTGSSGSGSADTTPSARARTGAQLYASLCASCHGASGLGDGPMVPELRTTPSNLTVIAAENGGKFPRDKVAETIDGRRPLRSHGPRNMPVWGRHFEREITQPDAPSEMMARDQIQALVDYLEAIQQEPNG